MTIQPLPKIMVAPNGARRTKADHPKLPVEIGEIVAEAVACFEAGAGALHAHVRDGEGRHVLDAGLYRELIAEMNIACPSMLVQITTEAVGRYSPQEQCELIRKVAPRSVSVALSEMLPSQDDLKLAGIYRECLEAQIAVQHILYSAEEFTRLSRLVADDVVPQPLQVLFVLGRYTTGQTSDPSMLEPFLAAMEASGIEVDWALCAFGAGEFDCLSYGLERGGKVRVGFENNLMRPDGALAADNREQVARISSMLDVSRS